MTLNFNDLLNRAFLDWPSKINLSDLVKSGSESTRYSIKGLYEISEDVAARYIGTPEEVILRNLHDAIYEVLHGVSAYVTRIEMSELRREAIRSRFEARLHDGIKIPELNCSPEDIQLIKDYFSENAA